MKDIIATWPTTPQDAARFLAYAADTLTGSNFDAAVVFATDAELLDVDLMSTAHLEAAGYTVVVDDEYNVRISEQAQR